MDNLKSRLTMEESKHTLREDKNGDTLSPRAQRGKPRCDKGITLKKTSVKPSKCYICGEPGHWARKCSQRKGDDEKKVQTSNTSKKKLHGEGLVSEALTLTSSKHKRDMSWVMDLGASDYMSNQKDWFATYEAFDSPTAVCIGERGCLWKRLH